ncbi:MAG: Gfo/Idh/MocA family oxidoreductase [Actinomycetota bacterium]|nr:Gfo/Idh/MocA family oxidoreductase [Actinomycetota bacterium]
MAERPLRVGVLGGGTMAALHLATLLEAPGVRVVGLAAPEIDRSLAKIMATREIEEMATEALLAPGALDAVVIATPTDRHSELASLAVLAGAAVFCEKPVTRTLAEAEHLAALAARFRAKVAVGHVLRYFPEYEAARRQVATGRIGTVGICRLLRANTSPVARRPWYGERARSGGVLLDLAIHDLDWCRWALGPIRRVFARASGPEEQRVVAVLARHTSGAISYLDASWRAGHFDSRLEVCGTEGIYCAEHSGDAGFCLVPVHAEAASYLPSEADGSAGVDDPYRRELTEALAWFAGGPAPRAVLEDGIEALRLALAAEESIAFGQPVELEDPR